MVRSSRGIGRGRLPAHLRAGVATLAAGALATSGLLLTAVPASAHAVLVGSSPENGEMVAEPPTEIVLEFNEPIQGDFTQVAVLDADENHYEAGDAEINGPEVIQPVADLSPGDYLVSYRVGSTDGHPVSGALEFTVGGSADAAEAEQPAEPTEPTEPDQPAVEDDTEDTAATSDGNAPLWLGAAAVVAVAAAVTFMLIRRRPGSGPDDTGADTGR